LAVYTTSTNLFFISLFTTLVPRWLTPPFAYLTGLIFYFFAGDQRRGARENLRVVLGKRNVEMVLISSYLKYSVNWTDIMRMAKLKGDKLQALIGRRGDPKPMNDAIANKTGAILISPHFGNWELGGFGLADQGYKVNVLTFREPDERVTEQMENIRKNRNIGVIYVDRDDTSPLAIIEAVNILRKNEFLCLIGDRDGSSNTITVNFFGRPTKFPAGAAYLAIATGAPIIPVFVPLENGKYSTLMESPIYVTPRQGDNREAIRDAIQKLADVFEKYIKKYPDQWYNFFDYWNEERSQ